MQAMTQWWIKTDEGYILASVAPYSGLTMNRIFKKEKKEK